VQENKEKNEESNEALLFGPRIWGGTDDNEQLVGELMYTFSSFVPN